MSGCSGSSNVANAPASSGTIAIASGTASVVQSAGAVVVSVSRTGGSAGAVSVSYATSDGTAVAGTDYTKASGTLSWADGDVSAKSFSVAITTTPGFNGTRAFGVTLSSVTGGASLGGAAETVAITGSGVPGTLAMSAASATVLQSAGSVSLSVTRSGGSGGAVSVSYATANGTAVAGMDYTSAAGTLSWADGDASTKSVSVPLATSAGFSGTRAFSFVLSGVTGGATLGTASETVSITGSGAPGTLAISGATQGVLQSAGTVAVTFTRSGGSAGAVSARYAESDGTAIGGTDYTASAGTVSWADGDAANKTVNIALTASPYFNGTKSFTVTLASATGGATLGNAVQAVTITGGLIAPSGYFSFTGTNYTWKLQLPIDQYGGTGGLNNIQYAAIEETTAALTGGFVDAYFYADTATYGGATDHIVFTAPSNGAVTTPGVGSDHTRSELRELYTGSDADSNNDWTSVRGGTLTASCVVQSVSVNSDEATIGQIHNQSYVFALMLYRPAYKDVAFDLYSSLGSSSHVRTSIVQNVNLGDAINYTIVYTGSTIAVTVNGTTQSFAVDPSWAGTPMYFKVGAYHAAPNIGNPAGDQTQVAFSSFGVSH